MATVQKTIEIMARYGMHIDGVPIDKRKRHIEAIRLYLDYSRPDMPEDKSTGFIAFNASGDKRMKIKTGRFFSKKLQLNSGFLKDSTIQKIAETTNDILFKDRTIVRIDCGEQIYDNYFDQLGGRSCMTGRNADCVWLYCDNPKVYSQLIMIDGGNSARAMLVKLDNGRVFMDRIYSDSEHLKEKMRDYGKNAGYLMRAFLTTQERLTLIVSNLEYENGRVPYQDTLNSGFYVANRKITIGHPYAIERPDFNLDSTCGEIVDQMLCCDCETGISEDNCYSADDGTGPYCRCCFFERYFYCEMCNESEFQEEGVYIDSENIQICERCADRFFAQCGECGELFRLNSQTENDFCADCLESHADEHKGELAQ